jgi:hypothetical protein
MEGKEHTELRGAVKYYLMMAKNSGRNMSNVETV